MQPYFDAMTGQLVNVGSPVGLLVLVVVVVAGLMIWKKVDKAGFNSALAKARAEVEEIEARIKQSGPEFVAGLKADLEKAKERLANLGK